MFHLPVGGVACAPVVWSVLKGCGGSHFFGCFGPAESPELPEVSLFIPLNKTMDNDIPTNINDNNDLANYINMIMRPDAYHDKQTNILKKSQKLIL